MSLLKNKSKLSGLGKVTAEIWSSFVVAPQSMEAILEIYKHDKYDDEKPIYIFGFSIPNTRFGQKVMSLPLFLSIYHCKVF